MDVRVVSGARHTRRERPMSETDDEQNKALAHAVGRYVASAPSVSSAELVRRF